ncbi:MAG: VWA domain-containing protein [Variibacter sp.]
MLRFLQGIVVGIFVALAFGAGANPARAQSADAILILDASGSMWGLVGNQTKISAARKAVDTILTRWKPSDRLGLMAYGHRAKGDCKDIELLVPVEPLDAGRIKTAVGALNPKGKTPIADSLRAAAKALRSSERKATVILVSDGIETCAPDPCAVAAELKKAGVGFAAHVIGFDVADPVAKAQLQCIARATGGVYLDARDAAGLESALGRAVEATRGEKVASEAPAKTADDPLKDKNLRAIARLAAGLDPIADEGLIWTLYKAKPDGSEGEYVQTEYAPRLAIPAAPGKYLLVVTYGAASRSVPVTVEKGKIASLDIALDAGFVVSEGKIGGSNAKAENVTWELRPARGDNVLTVYDPVPRFIVPAGDYTLKLSKGTASVSNSFAVTAGDTMNVALTLDAGRVIVTALYAAGGPPVKDELAVEIRQPPAVDGDLGEWVMTNYGPEIPFDLAAGSYDAIASVGKAVVAQRIEVKPGETKRIAITLNAGVAGFKAPGSSSIEIVSEERDINDQRTSLATGFDPGFNIALPAGRYVAVVEFDGTKVEKPFVVTAGKRTSVEAAK